MGVSRDEEPINKIILENDDLIPLGLQHYLFPRNLAIAFRKVT
jgi:hypothetical protein